MSTDHAEHRRHPTELWHRHGLIDPTIADTSRGVRALTWSFVALLATSFVQLMIALMSGSVALLADTIHNGADAVTAIPLWIAFTLARVPASRRFSYGLGRVEDLAGAVVVLIIMASAIVAGYESLVRLVHPAPLHHLRAVAAAAVVGFAGNEAVAIFRIRTGRAIGSAALVADGRHARIDGLASLSVLAGVAGAGLGLPQADPIVGLLITVVILGIAWQSGRAIGTRMLDGVEPEILDAVAHAARHVTEVRDIGEVRGRWVGHRLSVEVNVAVDGDLNVAEGHRIAKDVRHQILHRVDHVTSVAVHVDPATEAGEVFHRIPAHAHDGLPIHSHS